MNTLIWLFVGILLVIATVYAVRARINKWVNETTAQGPAGFLVVFLTLILVTGFGAYVVISILTMIAYAMGGALVGALLAIPLYLGAPVGVLPLICAVLGTIVFIIKLRKDRAS